MAQFPSSLSYLAIKLRAHHHYHYHPLTLSSIPPWVHLLSSHSLSKPSSLSFSFAFAYSCASYSSLPYVSPKVRQLAVISVPVLSLIWSSFLPSLYSSLPLSSVPLLPLPRRSLSSHFGCMSFRLLLNPWVVFCFLFLSSSCPCSSLFIFLASTTFCSFPSSTSSHIFLYIATCSLPTLGYIIPFCCCC